MQGAAGRNSPAALSSYLPGSEALGPVQPIHPTTLGMPGR